MKHLTRIAAKTQFAQPSWDPDAAYFDSRRYWCGPVWCQMNYLLADGLQAAGETAFAEKLRSDCRRLISHAGFRECFDPLTGDGCLGADFSWSAALWLAWARSS